MLVLRKLEGAAERARKEVASVGERGRASELVRNNQKITPLLLRSETQPLPA